MTAVEADLVFGLVGFWVFFRLSRPKFNQTQREQQAAALLFSRISKLVIQTLQLQQLGLSAKWGEGGHPEPFLDVLV